MTDAPEQRPRPPDLWRQRSVRALRITRDGSVRGWRWWARTWDRLVAALQDEAPSAPAPVRPRPARWSSSATRPG
ncbi:hypothetical protein [Micromonospora sp. CA-246542]|uniref:hypothetical protein n=1 Tax=Micromonospora sp. CA-246542 TaxID=3239959 RepID=UPI003D8A625C